MKLGACLRSLTRSKNPLIVSSSPYYIKSQFLSNSNDSIGTTVSSSSSSSSTKIDSLLEKLVEQPLSGIKSMLDSEDLGFSSAFESHEFSWRALITQLNSSSLQKSNLVIEWRLNKLIKEQEKNQDCYSELILALGSCRNFESALSVFSVMEAQGLKPNTSVHNALISACFSSNDVLTALSLFELMAISEDCKCDSDTYNAFISGYANLGNKDAMQAWYRARMAAGFIADAQTFEGLISGCVKSFNFDDAERYYEEVTLAGLLPTPSIVQNMVFVCCKKKNIRKVREHISYGSAFIDRRIARVVVDLYYEQGQVKYMEELLDVFVNANQSSEILPLIHYAIIKMYVKAERLDDVEYSVGRMLRDGISFQCHNDDVVDKVVCLYFRKAAYDRLDMFLKSIKDCYKLTKSTYDLLIAGYRRARLQEKLDCVMIEMKSDGFGTC